MANFRITVKLPENTTTLILNVSKRGAAKAINDVFKAINCETEVDKTSSIDFNKVKAPKAPKTPKTPKAPKTTKKE